MDGIYILKTFIIFLITFQFITGSYCFEPVLTVIVVGVVAIGLNSLRGGKREYCGPTHILNNVEGLERSLNDRLYGQHLVTSTVTKAIQAHVTNKNPEKALVMSFHGWTGGGKNYVSRMIVDNLYKRKEMTSFAHLFSGEVDFRHQEHLNRYKDQLYDAVYSNVSRCAQSMFVFDEMDHMPTGLLDVLKPFLNSHAVINGVDFTKAIFIFLSNTGGDQINRGMMNMFENGKNRESVKLREMQAVLEQAAFNQNGAFQQSGLIDRNLIDHFIPFLPLDRTHVRLCVLDIVRKQNLSTPTEDEMNDILDELQWVPKHLKLFSKSGCKKVEQKVPMILPSRPHYMNHDGL